MYAKVYDVKNLKRKIRPESENKVNSPWNIAAGHGKVCGAFHGLVRALRGEKILIEAVV